MASRGDHGAGVTRAMPLFKVLMPSSFQKMRISNELAAHLRGERGDGGAPRRAARVVSPLGKVWDVEVGRDGDGGAFLGRGWAEFAGAHGLGVGWFVVLRHEGGDVLTVKVFDTTCCLKDYGALPPAAARDASHKPQFLRVLLPGFMERMRIPDKFVQHYIVEENLNSNMAIILSPLGKFWRVELEKDQTGVFFKRGWFQFLSFHGISPDDVMLLRYEGNLVFKIKVFGHNGWQKDFEAKNIRIQQNTGDQQEPSTFSRMKCNMKNQRPGEDSENQHETPPCSRKVSRKRKRSGGETEKKSASIYEIGPPSWIKKVINIFILERCLSLAGTFCKSIGLIEESTITLKNSPAGGSSSRSWEVLCHVNQDRNGCCYLLGAGWKGFCHENGLKVGDVCTFNVVQTTLWHVVIDRSS
uniref:TF-B3 domain-containing protein n=1 Tax=Oryza punctata TaxID=4537 RepID=A0A0E0KP86_ORYPU